MALALRQQHLRHKYLSVIEGRAKALGIPYDGVLVMNDLPAAAIIETARDKNCDLIFMAARGNSAALALP
jgi:nucleotide-binding universal stress UspA family protein